MRSAYLHAFIVFLLSLGCIRAQSRPDVPTVIVRTESESAKVSELDRTFGTRKRRAKPAKVETSAVNIRVELTSAAAPKTPYDVQCFTIMRSDVDGAKCIGEAQHKASATQLDTILFHTNPIATGKKWVAIPASMMTAGGRPMSAEPTVTKRPKDAKYLGWVIRVVSAGVPVRHESNQPELKLIAEKTPAAFDLALTHSED